MNHTKNYNRQDFPYIEYLNSLQKTTIQINNLQQLFDGVFIYEIISSLKQYQNQDDFMYQPVTLVHRIQNIKLIIKIISKLWIKFISKQVFLEIDVLKIAKDKSTQQIIKLTKVVIKTLFHCCEKDYFVQKILQTTHQTQQFFMKILKQQQNSSISVNIKQQTKYYHNSFLDKILELQQQKEQLIKIIDELGQQNQDHVNKQKEWEQKFNQKQALIKSLTWSINQINESKEKIFDKSDNLILKQQRMLNDNLMEKIKQLQQREKSMLKQIQNMQHILKNQTKDLYQLGLIKKVYLNLQQDNKIIKQQKEKIQLQKSILFQQFKILQQKYASLSVQNQLNQKRILQIEELLKLSQQRLTLKESLIQELQNNIKYLTQLSYQKSQQLNQLTTSKKSIKAQCQQILHKEYNKANQQIIIRLKKQITSLNIQYQSALTVIENKKKQIQKLKQSQQENKKLVQMINHMHKYRGQQNQILVHCLYKMRMKLLGYQLKQKANNTINDQNKTIITPLRQSNRHY